MSKKPTTKKSPPYSINTEDSKCTHSFFFLPRDWAYRSQDSEMFPAKPTTASDRFSAVFRLCGRNLSVRTVNCCGLPVLMSKNIYFSASKPCTYASPFFAVSGWHGPTSLYALHRFTSPGKTGSGIHFLSCISRPSLGIL